jgi:hypothetical protein
MKIKELLPALKPGLILASLNLLLCGLFALGSAVAIGLSAVLMEIWELPIPLMPAIVLGAIPVTVISWLAFAVRIQQPRPVRYAIAAIGTSPLLALVAGAALFAIWFLTLPSTPAAAIISPVVISLVSGVATAVCAACVIWIRSGKENPAT